MKKLAVVFFFLMVSLCVFGASIDLKLIRRDAEAGNSFAQMTLGNMYYYGDGVPRNLAEADKWFRRASYSSPYGQYWPGSGRYQPNFIWSGLEVEALRGDIEAQFSLAEKLFHGDGVSRNYSLSAKWYREVILRSGILDKDRYYESSYYHCSNDSLRRVAETGKPNPRFVLGERYYLGQGAKLDLKEASRWFRKTAMDGIEYARYHGLPKRFYPIDYKMGRVPGQPSEYPYSHYYDYGRPMNHPYYGYPSPIYGNPPYLGSDPSRDFTIKDYNDLINAAQAGDSQAAYELGGRCYFGDGVPKDAQEAEKWYKQACKKVASYPWYDYPVDYKNQFNLKR